MITNFLYVVGLAIVGLTLIFHIRKVVVRLWLLAKLKKCGAMSSNRAEAREMLFLDWSEETPQARYLTQKHASLFECGAPRKFIINFSRQHLSADGKSVQNMWRILLLP